MISDSEIERLHAVCLAMPAAQIATVKKKAEKARAAALQWPPFAHPFIEFWRTNSATMGNDLADGCGALAGYSYLLELGILESLQDPRVLAIEALARHLLAAFDDTAIHANSGVVALLQHAWDELDYMDSQSTPSEIFHVMRHEAAKTAVSQRSAQAARSKNIEPRAWVATKWAARIDRGQSKSSFARQYAPLVKKQYGLDVTPDTIARAWLSKAGA